MHYDTKHILHLEGTEVSRACVFPDRQFNNSHNFFLLASNTEDSVP